MKEEEKNWKFYSRIEPKRRKPKTERANIWSYLHLVWCVISAKHFVSAFFWLFAHEALTIITRMRVSAFAVVVVKRIKKSEVSMNSQSLDKKRKKFKKKIVQQIPTHTHTDTGEWRENRGNGNMENEIDDEMHTKTQKKNKIYLFNATNIWFKRNAKRNTNFFLSCIDAMTITI